MLDKLEPGTKVFIDANIFLYEILAHRKYCDSCRRFLEGLNEGKYYVTSVLVCNEVFHRVMVAEIVEKFGIEPMLTKKYRK